MRPSLPLDEIALASMRLKQMKRELAFGNDGDNFIEEANSSGVVVLYLQSLSIGDGRTSAIDFNSVYRRS
jgi:hypothetical protein